ncbi:MAG: hypothetical protein ACRDHM_00215, partial [Actinomycetota bacterium]
MSRAPSRAVASAAVLAVAGWLILGVSAAGQTPAPELERLSRDIEAVLRPPLPSNDPLFLLAIGSDARPRGSLTRSLADSLHIIGVNPQTNVASILGIPRDSYVPIPGGGT